MKKEMERSRATEENMQNISSKAESFFAKDEKNAKKEEKKK